MNKVLTGVLFFLSCFLVTQPAYSMSKKKIWQRDVLILDATLDLVETGSWGAHFAAKEVSPEWESSPTQSPNADTLFVREVQFATDRLAMSHGFSSEALFAVSENFAPVLERWVPFKKGKDGWDLARGVANGLAQSAHPDTWGPDLLWAVTTHAARQVIKENGSVEEIGLAATRASWAYVLRISGQIGDSIRTQVGPQYLSDSCDAKMVLGELKTHIDGDAFKAALPEIQEYYKDYVSYLEQTFPN